MENEACMFHKNCDFERDVGDCPDRCLQFRGNTNFDRLRAMSDEELSEYLMDVAMGSLFDQQIMNVLEWGRQPYKEEQHGRI